ncbi:hypothetical protein F3Y22_tig00111779pilonHSYRG00272 [Hibiscus syriacus]|uniref:Uncharacterized protein n=1 Tax=Hibiscus syriacus TaxID=106335 RepID=A0A6A2YDA6_HIBSY|nr:hypothetical protein F3Y22_tig00111779pilonHSYRG00272 [Hibiscus syriacus]
MVSFRFGAGGLGGGGAATGGAITVSFCVLAFDGIENSLKNRLILSTPIGRSPDILMFPPVVT